MKLQRIGIVFIAAALVLSAFFYAGTIVSVSAADAAKPATNQTAQASDANKIPIFGSLLNEEPAAGTPPRSLVDTSLSILLKLLLAVILSAILAFRPRKNFPLFQRNLYVSQTQILLAVVAAALMMIVGDNAARAFAIFAAVSLVRFRTNIRDPKEVTVLLISLAIGLAAGVGRWDLGIALCLFSLALLWVLEYNEQEQAYRSMELTVQTRNTDLTQNVLVRIFNKYKIENEVRKIDPQIEDKPGNIQYYLNLRLSLSTDMLSDKIMSADPANIESIQWSKTKSATDIYQ